MMGMMPVGRMVEMVMMGYPLTHKHGVGHNVYGVIHSRLPQGGGA